MFVSLCTYKCLTYMLSSLSADQYPWITSQLSQPTVSATLGPSCPSGVVQKGIRPNVPCPATNTHPGNNLELAGTAAHHSNNTAPQGKTLGLPLATVVMATKMAPLFGSPSSTSSRDDGQDTSIARRKRKYKKREFSSVFFASLKSRYCSSSRSRFCLICVTVAHVCLCITLVFLRIQLWL